MRTNNDKVKNVIVSVYFVLIVFAILMATVFSAFSHLTPNPALTFGIIVFVFVGLLFLVHFIARFFEYDSDGVKVVIINRGLLLSDHFNYREHKLEFDKDRLLGFRINNYIVYKSIIFYIRDRNGGKRKESFNITLVTSKKCKYIKQSLSKIIKTNIKSNQSN